MPCYPNYLVCASFSWRNIIIFSSPGKAAERLQLHQNFATSTGNLRGFCKNIQGQSAGNEQSCWLLSDLKPTLRRLMMPTCHWAHIYFCAEKGPARREQRSLGKHSTPLTPSKLISSGHPALTSPKFKHEVHKEGTLPWTLFSLEETEWLMPASLLSPKPNVSKAVLTKFREDLDWDL